MIAQVETFTVCARHMDEALPLLGMTKTCEELFYALQAEFRADFKLITERV